eukprot:478542-Prymnesium_polylepis.1
MGIYLFFQLPRRDDPDRKASPGSPPPIAPALEDGEPLDTLDDSSHGGSVAVDEKMPSISSKEGMSLLEDAKCSRNGSDSSAEVRVSSAAACHRIFPLCSRAGSAACGRACGVCGRRATAAAGRSCAARTGRAKGVAHRGADASHCCAVLLGCACGCSVAHRTVLRAPHSAPRAAKCCNV